MLFHPLESRVLTGVLFYISECFEHAQRFIEWTDGALYMIIYIFAPHTQTHVNI